MKFQVILLSFLSTAALIAANPIAAAPEDELLGLVDPILALIAILVDPATPDEPTEPNEPDEPEPEPVVAKCPVISNEEVPSRTCPGVQCDVVEVFQPDDIIEFKCNLGGTEVENTSNNFKSKVWVRVKSPGNYFPQAYLDDACAKKVTEVCPEGKS